MDALSSIYIEFFGNALVMLCYIIIIGANPIYSKHEVTVFLKAEYGAFQRY